MEARLVLSPDFPHREHAIPDQVVAVLGVDAVVAHLFGDRAVADDEVEPAVTQDVDGRQGLGRRDRLAEGELDDRRGDAQPRGGQRGGVQRDEEVGKSRPVARHAVRRARRPVPYGDVGVLAEVERIDAGLFDEHGDLVRAQRLVGAGRVDADLHHGVPAR